MDRSFSSIAGMLVCAHNGRVDQHMFDPRLVGYGAYHASPTMRRHLEKLEETVLPELRILGPLRLMIDSIGPNSTFNSNLVVGSDPELAITKLILQSKLFPVIRTISVGSARARLLQAEIAMLTWDIAYDLSSMHPLQ
ncbi:hypothetical protein LFL97_13380 [Burkholderia sp. JSH-S8]|nr:hypothetical protein LFL97_13380 [Burkholderia sp. JSH-S8]